VTRRGGAKDVFHGFLLLDRTGDECPFHVIRIAIHDGLVFMVNIKIEKVAGAYRIGALIHDHDEEGWRRFGDHAAPLREFRVPLVKILDVRDTETRPTKKALGGFHVLVRKPHAHKDTSV